MKIFIYKTAIVTILFVIVFEFLIGSRINNFKKQLNELTAKHNRERVVIKIKEEIKKANAKENYLSEEDRILLSTFIKKIIRELNLEK
tara:strand:+ start:71 stop:334 length:264 start_codon:yes stop_codon:yes gene_type:complete